MWTASCHLRMILQINKSPIKDVENKESDGEKWSRPSGNTNSWFIHCFKVIYASHLSIQFEISFGVMVVKWNLGRWRGLWGKWMWRRVELVTDISTLFCLISSITGFAIVSVFNPLWLGLGASSGSFGFKSWGFLTMFNEIDPLRWKFYFRINFISCITEKLTLATCASLWSMNE